MRIAIGIITLSCLEVGLSICRTEAGGAPLPQPVMVTTVSASDVPIFSTQRRTPNPAEVRGRVDGYIDKWLFTPGQEVHAGDALYVLDVRPYEAALKQAKGNLAQSESGPGVRA